ncbi:hypothetical protein BSK59_15960 [Paenibacillus odorifer]|uniref:hypothetical protein n=1 Tax=Paenibacillus odorifer TaxID=189426 RepID=UPI00096CB9BD|nr:hypothetical protein [Paenibacillus odorifer]OME54075.1 hypothetical protein BSK59_15960 [Paenibacillus odorifer]
MSKFKVGDRVVVTNSQDLAKKGMVGKIVVEHDHNNMFGVEFDEYMSGHSILGKCKNGHGWNVYGKNIELIKQEVTIVEDEIEDMTIEYKGTTTTVILGDGSKGVSKLKVGDRYNKKIGFQIAKTRALVSQKHNEIKSLEHTIKTLGG